MSKILSGLFAPELSRASRNVAVVWEEQGGDNGGGRIAA
jgi:hypothetical protein